MKRYSKAIVAASGVLIAIGEAGRDGSFDATEGFTIVTAIGVLVGVFFARNAPAKP